MFLQFLLNEAWSDEFEPYLENNCSGGIYATGHSQGHGNWARAWIDLKLVKQFQKH